MDLRLELHQARQARLAKWAAAALPAHKPALIEPPPEPIEPPPPPVPAMLPTPPLVAVERAIKFRAEVKAPKQLPPSTPAHSVFPGLIADAICAEILSGTGYTVADIKGHRRVFPLVPLRHQCIAAVSEKFLNWSLPRIGRYFGGRDHSTILHSLRCVGAWPRGSYWEAQKHGQMSLFSQGAGK